METEIENKLEEFCRYAFECARSDNVADLDILLNYGLNVNLANEKGDTLLMLAAYNGSVNATRILLERGADTEKLNDKHLSVLSGACFKGNYEIVKMLLEHGASVHSGAFSPINCAIMFGRKKILRLLKMHMIKKPNLLQRLLLQFYM